MSRGPAKFSFTYADIASVVGLKPKTVRNHAHAGALNPHDLRSICNYVLAQLDHNVPGTLK